MTTSTARKDAPSARLARVQAPLLEASVAGIALWTVTIALLVGVST